MKCDNGATAQHLQQFPDAACSQACPALWNAVLTGAFRWYCSMIGVVYCRGTVE
jgi:hypothetical protein